MNMVYFLDIFLFMFILQFIFYLKEGVLLSLKNQFYFSLKGVFGFEMNFPLSSIISFFTFIILLTCCFGGYFVYSFCPCGMLEFTFFYSLVAWLSTVLTFLTGEKFSVYMSKGGDSYLKTLSMLLVEIVSEFSRPLALTVRLTVNVMVGHLISVMIYMGLELLFSAGMIWITVLAIMLECFVFFIQSYIFSRLIFLYLNE